MSSQAQTAEGLEPRRSGAAAGSSERRGRGLKGVLWRTWTAFNEDRVMLIAAGGTFYILLALFPALAAFVSMYGLVADPATITQHLYALSGLLPAEAIKIIADQLMMLTSQPPSALGFGFIFGLLVSLWSANNGIKTLFEAMNIAFDENEKRNFFKLNLITLGMTFGALVLGILFIVGLGVVPVILSMIGLGGVAAALISLLRWPVLLAATIVGLSVLYSYGPSRERPEWRWISWGSGVAAVAWIAVSILFSWYLQNFGNYNATYGSLGTVIGFMMWTWISLTVILAGAELDAAIEHQAKAGAERPMAQIGAGQGSMEDGKRREGQEASGDRRRARRAAFPPPQRPSLGGALVRFLPIVVAALVLRPRKAHGERPEAH